MDVKPIEETKVRVPASESEFVDISELTVEDLDAVSGISEAQNVAAQSAHVQISPGAPEFIDTDFTKPLLAEAHSQTAHALGAKGIMDLSQPRGVPVLSQQAQSCAPPQQFPTPNQAVSLVTSPVIAQPLMSQAMSQSQAVSLLQSQQMKAVTMGLTSVPTVLTQSQAMNAPRATLSPATNTPQATFINVNHSLGGATLISQPIQVLSPAGYQQVMGSMPQFATGPGGQTLLMPLTQAGSILHPGNLQRAQVINSQGFTKNLQPQSQNVIPQLQAQSVAMATKLVGNMTGITTFPGNMVTMTTAAHGNLTGTVIPLASVNALQTSTAAGTNQQVAAHTPNTIPLPQVLNVPRVQLPNIPIQPQGQMRSPEPKTQLLLHHQQPLRAPIVRPSIIQTQHTQQINLKPPDQKQLSVPQTFVSQDRKLLPSQPSQLQLIRTSQPPGGGTVFIASPPSSLPEARIQLPLQIRQAVPTQSDDAPLNLDTKKPVKDGQQLPPMSAFTPVTPNSGAGPRSMTVSTEPLVSMSVASNLVQLGQSIPSTVPAHCRAIVPVSVCDSSPAATDVKTKTVKQEVMPSAASETPENTKICFTADAVPVEYDDPEFVWEDYLEETGATQAPPTAFTHVECSLESGIHKGMKVEVTRSAEPDSYWLATIMMTCGPLLRMRYVGYEDGSADFWMDVGSPDMHPVGWGKDNKKTPQPPQAIKDKIEVVSEFISKELEGASSVPAYLLDGNLGVTPIDQIKLGQRLEVQHELAPQSVWIVRVLENVGGRLLLRFEGTDRALHDFWLFYLHHRLHPIGWGKGNGCVYKPPNVILSEHGNNSEWNELLQRALKEATEMVLPNDIFKDQEVLLPHSMMTGWKLEALHPKFRFQISPATVVEVFDRHFIVEIDDLEVSPEKKVKLCCHSRSKNIFPSEWCKKKGLRLTPPKGWNPHEFDWQAYLAEQKATVAPENAFHLEVPEHGFVRGMKLEAVNPSQPGQISAATITRIIDNIMWIHLDSCAKIMANHIVCVASQDLFPVGWCASNGYPLKPPRKAGLRRGPMKKVAVVQPERAEVSMSAEDYRSITYTQIKTGNRGSSWCPKIYFNHKCFSGPFLSKGRIAELPRCVGPGPIPLVLKEVLSMLINVAYKSSRVLRELQLEGQPNPSMHPLSLKAKYKGKSYCAVVEVCNSSEQIQGFCRQVCIKLECCPNLFSPQLINGSCPENCSQLTKTKYTYYYGKKKKRKIGRPPGGHSNLENGPMKTGKRRKKRRVNLMVRKKSTCFGSATQIQNGDIIEDDPFEDDKSSNTDRTDTSSVRDEMDPEFQPPRKKRKYQHKIPPPSMIKTRGAILPKYSFERRTHKKIMLTSPPQGRNKLLHHMSPSCIISSKVHKKQPLYKQEDLLQLDSNPLYWTVAQVVQFMKTTDCAHLARLFRDEEIDGQALLLLSLPAVQEHLELKLGPAIKLCHHIERVKIAFYEQFAK